MFDAPADFLRELRRMGDVRADAIYVALKDDARKNIRGEVAVTAFRAAERHGDVDSQGHRLIIPPAGGASSTFADGRSAPHSNVFHPAACLGHLFKVPC